MANEKLYVKNGKVRTLNAISVVVGNMRYTAPNDEVAKSLGFDDVDAMLASCGWQVYAPEEVAVTLEDVIAQKIAEIQSYADSSAVKKFTVNGEEAWFDATERASMRNLYEAQKKDEQTSTTMWINGKAHNLIPIDDAIALVDKMEIYAGKVFNVTQSHIAFVKESKSVSEAESFNVTEDYPTILSFELN